MFKIGNSLITHTGGERIRAKINSQSECSTGKVKPIIQAGATIERVSARATIQRIITITTQKGVITILTDNVIIASAAIQRVISSAAEKLIGVG
jgi:phosphosulfolactate synthase (CoM biosynthesis protein A)